MVESVLPSTHSLVYLLLLTFYFRIFSIFANLTLNVQNTRILQKLIQNTQKSVALFPTYLIHLSLTGFRGPSYPSGLPFKNISRFMQVDFLISPSFIQKWKNSRYIYIFKHFSLFRYSPFIPISLYVTCFVCFLQLNSTPLGACTIIY